jgi:hypothetical protein
MRRLFAIYAVLLVIQFTWNPFVPEQDNTQIQRLPQTLPEWPTYTDPKSSVYLDEYGLIVQADGDGGDTAQRTGMYYYLQDDPAGFEKALDLLEVHPGIFVRHPQQDDFRSDPREFSRDQQRPLVIALGKYKMRDRLWRMLRGHVLRLGKYQNMDFIGPVGVGEYIRSFEAKPLYPALVITDLCLLVGSVYLAAEASFDTDEVDDNNHVMTLIQAQQVMPTPLGWLAAEAYLRLRPRNKGNFFLGKENPVLGALAWYHRRESGGNPFLGNGLYQKLTMSLPEKQIANESARAPASEK